VSLGTFKSLDRSKISLRPPDTRKHYWFTGRDRLGSSLFLLDILTSPGGAHVASALETLPAHIATIKAAAHAVGRNIQTPINPIVVFRDTPEEAEAYAEQIFERQA
jgi:hypothetical protein